MVKKNITDKLEKSDKNLKLIVICLSIVAVVALSIFALNLKSNNSEESMIQGAVVLETKLSPAELKTNIYPKFICACCGNTLDKCACGMARDMKNYIDSLAEEGLSEDEVVLTAVKKYGLTSLADESLQEQIQDELIKTAPKNKPIISIEPSNYDFGDVSQAKGIISTIFTIKNKGKSDLIIDNMKSSCHCTTATIIYNGIEGPRFGMHNNPTGWSVSIKPGKKAQLKIYYDPNAHGKFRGTATRTIDIFSNDPINFQQQVRIDLNQVP